jgi:hypothetical protein
LDHALGEREPAPRLYILHFHGFYVPIVDPHVVMFNKKKAFQFLSFQLNRIATDL